MIESPVRAPTPFVYDILLIIYFIMKLDILSLIYPGIHNINWTTRLPLGRTHFAQSSNDVNAATAATFALMAISNINDNEMSFRKGWKNVYDRMVVEPS